ncbi:Signal peptidase complex subunit 2 [Operophtera brumata]|uniref:Signal peptidase complex subunit 2 n=1 Tax=Operophtera brumata TaxID=104452 RepID=A0A0L7KPZ4_OPEBR|nr:Signal peptidase complex subunit 2 [Operophtera brumata]
MTDTKETVKINKWDGAAAKNAIDDAIREVLTGELKCKESFALMDGRLLLCALAVGVALHALLWDYLYPFPQHDDKYNLVLSLRDAHGKYREASITKSFANFIDTNGLVAQNLVINEVTKIYNSLSSEKKDK